MRLYMTLLIRRKRVDGRAKTRSSATTAARRGEAKLYHRKEKQKSHTVLVLCYSRSGKNTQNAPTAPRGGGSTGRKETNTKNRPDVPQFSGLTTLRPLPGTERGRSAGRKTKRRNYPIPTAQTLRKRISSATIERPGCYPDQPRHLTGGSRSSAGRTK